MGDAMTSNIIRTASAIMASSLLLAGLAGYGKALAQKPASANSIIPSQADLNRLKGDGLMQAARDASKLELFLHYKLMQANGLEQALGGEQKAVAALTAASAAFERSASAAQTNIPRMIPIAFDGNGLAAGVMGVGYGLVGSFIVGVLGGNMTREQVADAVKRGRIGGANKDGSGQIGFSQGATDLEITDTVNKDGLTGTVKTRTHVDACPDADGKLVVEIDSESRMSAGKKSGSVKVKLHYERWLDDDANLTDKVAYDIGTEMSGSGSSNNSLGFAEHDGLSRDGVAVSEVTRQHGFDIFHMEDVKTTEKLRDSTAVLLKVVAEGMLALEPWKSGRCVDLNVRSDPVKRTGARPNTAFTLYAEPRSKLDGLPTRGTVTATLQGGSTLNPTGPVRADARYDYANPSKKNETASIDFEARSKRGVGKASLAFDTKEGQAYRIVAGPHTFTVCDITRPFSHSEASPGGKVTLSFTPTDGRSGAMVWRFEGGGGVVNSSHSYTLSGPEEQMTGVFRATSGICAKAGMAKCVGTPTPILKSTWTQIDGCEGK